MRHGPLLTQGLGVCWVSWGRSPRSSWEICRIFSEVPVWPSWTYSQKEDSFRPLDSQRTWLQTWLSPSLWLLASCKATMVPWKHQSSARKGRHTSLETPGVWGSRPAGWTPARSHWRTPLWQLDLQCTSGKNIFCMFLHTCVHIDVIPMCRTVLCPQYLNDVCV